MREYRDLWKGPSESSLQSSIFGRGIRSHTGAPRCVFASGCQLGHSGLQEASGEKMEKAFLVIMLSRSRSFFFVTEFLTRTPLGASLPELSVHLGLLRQPLTLAIVRRRAEWGPEESFFLLCFFSSYFPLCPRRAFQRCGDEWGPANVVRQPWQFLWRG